MPQDWFAENKPKDDWFAQNAKPPVGSEKTGVPGVSTPKVNMQKQYIPPGLTPEGVAPGMRDIDSGMSYDLAMSAGTFGAAGDIKGLKAGMNVAEKAPSAASKIPTFSPLTKILVKHIPFVGKPLAAGMDVLEHLKSTYGEDLTKLPRRTQQDIAFDLYKDAHGAAPSKASEEVQAIKEMREALKATPKPKPAAATKPEGPFKPNPAVARKMASGGPAPKEYGALARPERVGKAVEPTAEPIEDTAFQVNPKVAGKIKSGGPAPTEYGSIGRPERVGKAVAPEKPIKPSPKGTLSTPATARQASAETTGPTPNAYQSVKRTDAGAVLRRDNFKAGIAKEYPNMTREQFLKLSTVAKNQLIRKYNPQSVNRPYIESSKVFEEFADHVWPK
jgi:hypothetical protein